MLVNGYRASTNRGWRGVWIRKVDREAALVSNQLILWSSHPARGQYKADVGACAEHRICPTWGARGELAWVFIGDPTFPSPLAAMEGLRARMKERCPNIVWNVLRQDENSVLYEWRISDCPGQPDQHEIARFLRVKVGTYRIAYAAKGKEILPSRRDQWIDLLWQVRRQERIE